LADQALLQLGAAGVVSPDGWVAVEHNVDDVLADAYGPLRLTAARRYGKRAVALFSNSRMVEQAAASWRAKRCTQGRATRSPRDTSTSCVGRSACSTKSSSRS